MVFHFCIVLVLLIWAVAPPSAMAQEKPKIFLGASSKTLGYSPLWVGARKGFFEKQGLDVQLVLLRGMPMTVQALSAGSLHIGSGGAEPYIDASERGLDFILTGGVINGTAQFIVAAKSIKTYEDLRGATFGTASLTGGTITVLREALKVNGIPARLQAIGYCWRLSHQSRSPAVGSNQRDNCRRPVKLCGRRSRFQYHRQAFGRGSLFSNQRYCDPKKLGGKKSRRDGAFYASDGGVAALAA